MDAKFFNGLFEGDSPNGAKLGMGLTGGDLWPRPAGCLNLYRGPQWYDIDFAAIIAVADANANGIVAKADSAANTTYALAVRAVNGCGEEDASLSAILRAAFDAAGDLLPPDGRNVIALSARQIAQSTVRLVWLYVPYHAPTLCEQFNIYSDGASGMIDFVNAVASVPCVGPGIYSHELPLSQPGRYRFCVRCQSQMGNETCASIFAAVDVSPTPPNAIAQLKWKVI